MSYFDFLKMLLALGPKITQVWPHLQKIAADEMDALAEAQAIVALLQGSSPAPNLVAMTIAKVNGEAITAEVLEVEARVVALVSSNTAGFDAASVIDLLKSAAAYLMAHPELWQLLLKLIGGLAPVAPAAI